VAVDTPEGNVVGEKETIARPFESSADVPANQPAGTDPAGSEERTSNLNLSKSNINRTAEPGDGGGATPG